jgi:hypothetical protein
MVRTHGAAETGVMTANYVVKTSLRIEYSLAAPVERARNLCATGCAYPRSHRESSQGSPGESRQ